jgi:hypothetical protein
MQDRYAGDIGDFGKLALLRSLSPGRKLGVCWYFCTGRGETNNDGKHTKYLQQPGRFRALDPELFDALQKLTQGERAVEALEKARLLTEPIWHREPVPCDSARDEWFRKMQKKVDQCSLVFADPDNGIARSGVTPKHISVDEIRELRREERALLVYHHQTRMRGGATIEARYLALRVDIRPIDVVRIKSYSSRLYFLFGADDELRARLHKFAKRWEAEAELVDVSDRG